MKLLETTPTGYKFETSSGCTWTREKLVWAKKSVDLSGWLGTRELYELSDTDKEFFPNAAWRMSLTPHRDQNDPLFVTVPVRLKPGRKTILEIFEHDGSIVGGPIRIRRIFNWE